MNRNDPTMHIQSAIDIRTLARLLTIFNRQKIPHHSSWSNVIRKSIEAFITVSNPPEVSVQEALNIIKSEGFSMRQLHLRGDGIRQQLKIEGSIDEMKDIMEAITRAEAEGGEHGDSI